MKNKLDDQKFIAGLDKNNMLATVAAMPDQLLDASKIADMTDFSSIKKPNKIVIAGMGGSAISGDILSAIIPEAPIFASRNYSLPNFVDENTLIVASSYSGGTEETLSAVKEAIQKKLPVVCITSGGKLFEIASKEKLPVMILKPGLQPRAALPYILTPLFFMCQKLGLVNNATAQLEEAVKLLNQLKLDYLKDEISSPAKQFAKKLSGKIPIILASPGITSSAAKRFKTQLNENSKMTAHLSVFPEMNHNEIVNLSILKKGSHNFALVVLRDEEDNVRIQKRIEITKSLIGINLGGVNEFISSGKSRFARVMSLIYLGDLASVYLALLADIDPTQVDIISKLKKELQR